MRPSRPTTSGAAQSALSTASSVASTTASNTSFRSRVGHVRAREPLRAGADRAARTRRRSRRCPWCATEPQRASPSPARRATRSSWCAESGASTATTAMQLPAFERRVVGRLAEELADRNAVHDERRRGVEVREDEDADGAADRRSDPARGPDAGLVALRHHPGPGADRSLGDGPPAAAATALSDVLGLDLHDRVPPRASCRRTRRRRG